MDCKDLMVGDWVYVVRGYDKHHTIEKIKGVIADEDEPYPVTISTGETVSLNDIKPIPLTSDILVKNGFEKFTESQTNFDYTDNDIHLEYWIGDGVFRYYTAEIHYVHQLQHLMRLFGIEREIEL